jgi:negative regulator of flagellin synthesis FlgM
MPIEINGYSRNPVPGATDNSSAKARRDEATARPETKSPGGDSVSLTGGASHLHELERKIADASEVDAKRIEELRHALSDGRYQVDAPRVADKMMALEGLLGTRSK